MMQTKTDWQHHIKSYHSSSQTIGEYCAAVGVKPDTFRYHLYKKKSSPVAAGFKEFPVAGELVISRGQNGGLSITGFDLSQLPEIVGAWSNALPR